MERRHFLKNAALSGLVGSMPRALASSTPQGAADSGEPARGSIEQIPLGTNPGTLKGEMLYRTLGRTGEHISAIGLGGSHVAKPSVKEDETIRLIRTAVDRGITFMDNSWDYNEGQSEIRMGKALRDGYRQKVLDRKSVV